jgi:hypothetical protein
MSFCKELGSGYLPVFNVSHYRGIVRKQRHSLDCLEFQPRSHGLPNRNWTHL